MMDKPKKSPKTEKLLVVASAVVLQPKSPGLRRIHFFNEWRYGPRTGFRRDLKDLHDLRERWPLTKQKDVERYQSLGTVNGKGSKNEVM